MPYQAEGSLDSKIAFVAEAPAKEEMRIGRPMVGPSGKLHDSIATAAGISRRQCYITNVVDHDIGQGEKKYAPFITSRGTLTALGQQHADRLKEELDGFTGNVIVPLGNLALIALCGKAGITKFRGSILPCTLIEGKKCIPSIHVAATFKGQYIWRYLIRYDYKRIKREAEFSNISRPRYEFILNPSISQCHAYLADCRQAKVVSVDIENPTGPIERICFSVSETSSISIPFMPAHGVNAWTFEEEVPLILDVATVLSDPSIEKIGQNFIYDTTIILREFGIITRGRILDTMVAHHLMYPDFGASLALFCSIYTDQPYYKDMVKAGSFEKKDG